MATTAESGKIVPPNEVDAVVARIPPFSIPRCAAIAFGPLQERPRNLGTLTVVKMFGSVFLVTAKHVVESDSAKEFPWRVLVPVRDAGGQIPDRKAISPWVFPIDTSAVVWKSARNDVAVLRAPSNLGCDNFDGEQGAVKAARTARATWDEGRRAGRLPDGRGDGMPEVRSERPE